MPSTEKTGYLNLTQYQENDITSWMEDYNSDMRKIDAGVQENHGEIADNKQSILTMQTNITSNTSAIEQINTNIAGNPEKFAQIEAELNNHDTLINGNANNITNLQKVSWENPVIFNQYLGSFDKLQTSEYAYYGKQLNLKKGLYLIKYVIAWANDEVYIPLYPSFKTDLVEPNTGNILVYSHSGYANAITSENKQKLEMDILFLVNPNEEYLRFIFTPTFYAVNSSSNPRDFLGIAIVAGSYRLQENKIEIKRIGGQ